MGLPGEVGEVDSSTGRIGLLGVNTDETGEIPETEGIGLLHS
jgi:hypothetical protein